ncbi:MAG: insulinase family protein [Tissierellaceae bacterium]|nr:insulinase family protein [Tissierellaceae bacterium]
MATKIYDSKNIKEKLYYRKMDSGLKVYYIPKEGYTKQYAIFATEYGSIDNIFTPRGETNKIEVPEGIAHFLEHKLFESPDNNIFDKFSQLGADVNAYTNFNRTAYLFSSTENFYESLGLLIDFVQSPYFTDENVEKEKGIIAQEINMYLDSPGWRVYFNCLKAMYYNHPVKIDIAGTVDSIQGITKELLYKCYNTFYNPSNMVLFVIGDLDFENIIEVVDKHENKSKTEVEEIHRFFPEEPKIIKEKLVEENMLISTPVFYIGFKDLDVNLTGEKLVKSDLITDMILDILFGTSSKFYNDLYEEGLIDSSFGAVYTGDKTYGHSLIVGESKEPKTVYNKVLELIKRPVEDLFTEADFERIKRKTMGDFLMGLNSVEFVGNNFIDLYFSDFMIVDYLDLLENIRYEDIIDRFNSHLKEDNVVLSIIKPLEK